MEPKVNKARLRLRDQLQRHLAASLAVESFSGIRLMGPSSDAWRTLRGACEGLDWTDAKLLGGLLEHGYSSVMDALQKAAKEQEAGGLATSGEAALQGSGTKKLPSKLARLRRQAEAALQGRAAGTVRLSGEFRGPQAVQWRSLRETAQGLGFDESGLVALLLKHGYSAMRDALTAVPRALPPPDYL